MTAKPTRNRRKARQPRRGRAGTHPTLASGATLRYRPLDPAFLKPEFTDHVNPLPWQVLDDPDGPETDDERNARRRVMATNFFFLPIVCAEPACRRARCCSIETAPCILRYKRLYQDYAPHIYKRLKDNLPPGAEG